MTNVKNTKKLLLKVYMSLVLFSISLTGLVLLI